MSFKKDCEDLAEFQRKEFKRKHELIKKVHAAVAEKARAAAAEKAREKTWKAHAAAAGKTRTLVRTARLKSAREKSTHTKKQWIAVLEEFDYRCVRCGCYPIGGPTKDHIIPICRGGSDAIDNLQPLCRQCNSSGGGLVRNFSASEEVLGHLFNWIEWRRANGFGLGTGCFSWRIQL